VKLVEKANAIVGATPGFPAQLGGSGALHAVPASAAYRKSGTPHRFRPQVRVGEGHPSYSFGLCNDTDSIGTHLEIVLTQNLQPDVFSFTAH
jgi:hypothetical protein